MRSPPSDTSPDADDVLLRLARTLPAARKLSIAASMTSALRELAATGVRSRSPGLSDEAFRRRLAAVLLPHDLAAVAYGWSPEADGY
jgi:hypothetical protein